MFLELQVLSTVVGHNAILMSHEAVSKRAAMEQHVGDEVHVALDAINYHHEVTRAVGSASNLT